MTTIILCSDGSELASQALSAGWALLRPADRVVIATVVDEADETLVTGASGFAGGSMSPEEFEEHERTKQADAEQVVDQARAVADTGQVETRVLRGRPGPALCDLATELDADAIIMGSRGNGGLKRAFLGSVSDHVVRNAPCVVVIAPQDATDA